MCALFRRKAMPAGWRPGQALIYMQDTQDNMQDLVRYHSIITDTNRQKKLQREGAPEVQIAQLGQPPQRVWQLRQAGAS